MKNFKNYEELEKKMENEGYDTFEEFVLADIGNFYEDKVINIMKDNSFYLIAEDKFKKMWSMNGFKDRDNDVFNDMFYFRDIDDVKKFEKNMTFDKTELVYWLTIYYNLDEDKNWIIFTEEDRKKSLKENVKRIYQTFTGYNYVPNMPNLENEVRDFHYYFCR